MQLSDFDYSLPESLIAQYPAEQRDGCRLLVLGRADGSIRHCVFSDLVGLLQGGDLLVLNNTRVLPARLACRRNTGGAAEVLFTERLDDRTWKALCKPGRRLLRGATLTVEGAEGAGRLHIKDVTSDGERVIELVPGEISTIAELIERHGVMPLPPYIRRTARREDAGDYQTVYASRPGAVAAPTAGLHFTPDLFRRLSDRGVETAFVTLHVGIGTFLPVKTADPRDHVMHEEAYELPPETVAAIGAAKRRGGRIVAVGTTVVRVLEHCAASGNGLTPGSGVTRLKILPPYTFQVVDALITNFHLPKSTLLMLVSAFAGLDSIKNAYTCAVEAKYRFFSYGDAMLII